MTKAGERLLDAGKEMRASIFGALPGYPFLPCPICADEGYPNETEGCDHTVLERARRTYPGLVIPPPPNPLQAE